MEAHGTTPAAIYDRVKQTIRLETDRMSALVDDLFELSRINAGALRLTDAPASTRRVVRETALRVLYAVDRPPITPAYDPAEAQVAGLA